MNDYITIGSYKYKCRWGEWIPYTRKPATVRRELNGNIDVTYGPGAFHEWRGRVEASTNPPSGYGTPANLLSSLESLSSITFVDHEGTSYTAHALGPFEYSSLTPKWDGTSNKVFYTVTLVAEAS